MLFDAFSVLKCGSFGRGRTLIVNFPGNPNGIREPGRAMAQGPPARLRPRAGMPAGSSRRLIRRLSS